MLYRAAKLFPFRISIRSRSIDLAYPPLYTKQLHAILMLFYKDMRNSYVGNRGTKSGEATPRSAHESFDAWPGN